MDAHADRKSRISIVITGRLRESVGSSDEYAVAGSLAIKPGHVVHRNLFGPQGAGVLSIELPDWLLTGASAEAIGQWRWFHGGPLAVSAIRVWLAARQPVQAATLADLLVDFVATVEDLGRPPGRHHSPPYWLSRVRQQLADESPRETRSLSALAAEAGVHPVYLARLFRRHFRCSISEHVQALRLTRAVERMASTVDSLSDIAMASGYADQSHFSRSCQRGFALSPGRCRALLEADGTLNRLRSFKTSGTAAR